MKTDRELLELAAKAAGIGGEWSDYHRGICYSKPDNLDMHVWLPLTDDGDALRLAVILKLRVFPQDKCCYVESCPESLLGLPGVSELEMYGHNRYTATRRAIVRAAAAIGEGME